MYQEVFKFIPNFEGYRVSNHGRIINDPTGREMVLSPTMHGELTVGLYRNGTQYRRSVKVLVAKAFVPGEDRIFDTPILLDGDRENLKSDNMMWRPRWFALEYTKQMNEPQDWHFSGPITNVSTRQEYANILQAAIYHGLLCSDIRKSIIQGTRVFPYGEIYASPFV